MRPKKIRVRDKGQFTIPSDFRKRVGIKADADLREGSHDYFEEDKVFFDSSVIIAGLVSNKGTSHMMLALVEMEIIESFITIN